MPPKAKFQKKQIVDAAMDVARKKGIEAVTAREVAAALKVSSRPIFTWFDSMDALRAEVIGVARERYRGYIEQGLTRPLPFLGVWQQFILFAREEPELYKLLFLSRSGKTGGAAEVLRFSQDMVRESLMRFYRLDAKAADSYFRDLWLVSFSIATLIVTEECPYTDEEIFSMGREISLSVLKAYKEVPGLVEGTYDADAVFTELVGKDRGGETEVPSVRPEKAQKTREDGMDGFTYITLRERPEMIDAAAGWFHEKWGVPEEAYLDCMREYLEKKTENGWYLCLDGSRIVGGLGVIENDFHDRKDLAPNVCAVYTEETYRCRGIAGRLLDMAVEDMRQKGVTPIYLLTDHVGFYERYGWEFYCMVQGDSDEEPSRMYIHR